MTRVFSRSLAPDCSGLAGLTLANRWSKNGEMIRLGRLSCAKRCLGLGGLWLVSSLLLAACAVERDANPAHGCGECPPDKCYNGYCLRALASVPAPVSGVTIDKPGGNCKEEGSKTSCYLGPKESRGVGDCRDGEMTCADGTWGDCEGQVKPITETCNGRDDDCDGKVDDGLGGSCPTTCNAMAVEKCDGIDNDCDGNIDEDSDKPCYGGTVGCSAKDNGFTCVGLCKQGIQRCENGKLSSSCEGQVLPRAEVCDSGGATAAMDEDCDGQINNGCDCTSGQTQDCYGGLAGTASVGICKMGRQACVGSGFGQCQGEVKPGAETCMNPGADDDCDGMVDNVPSLGVPCLPERALAECRGTLQCAPGSGALTCVAVPRDEVCGGGDEDCDGTIDEASACTAGRSCCGRSCVNLNEDASHCGRCNLACDAGQSCVGGRCMSAIAGSGGGGGGAGGKGAGGAGAGATAGAGGGG